MKIEYILNDQSTSFWLHHALTTALKRDIVDAVNDAEILFQALSNREKEIREQLAHEMD